MARTTNITRDLVIETLNRMKENGQHITAASLRTELGGGKYETYSTFFNEWKKGQVNAGKEIATIEIAIPQEALKAVNEAAKIIWQAATNHHAESIKAIQAETELKIELEIKDKEEAKELVKSLEIDLEKKENELEEVINCKDKLITKVNSLELQIQKLQLCLDNEIEKNGDLKEKNKSLININEDYLKLTGKYELVVNENKLLIEKANVKEEIKKTIVRKKPETVVSP